MTTGETVNQDPPAEHRRRRILILSADVGEGHDAAARSLTQDLHREDPAAEIIVSNGLEVMSPFLHHSLRDTYRVQLRRFAWSYALVYYLYLHVSAVRDLGRLVFSLLGARGLLRAIEWERPDVIVSAYPIVTAVLGRLRRRGKIAVPVFATVTDIAGVELWAERGVDHHLVMHPACVPDVESVAGPCTATVVRPLVANEFLQPRRRDDARRDLDLPQSTPVVLVTGGGWGVGDLEGAVDSCRALDGVTVVAVCGKNEGTERHLRGRFADDERVRVLGFTKQMNDLLAGCDVLVHSTGGVTALEALVRRRPIVMFGTPPGHVRLNAKRLADLGLARSAHTADDLRSAVVELLADGRHAPSLPPAPSAASLILGLSAHAPSRVPAAQRVRRVAVVALATALLVLGILSTNAPYGLAARTFDLRPVTRITTEQPRVGLVLRAPENLLPALATRLASEGAHASFALKRVPASATIETIRATGNEALPEMGSGSLARWVRTRHVLREEADALGLPPRFTYLAPPSGYTLGQYLETRYLGARPIRGALRLDSAADVGDRAPAAGDIVVLSLTAEGPEPPASPHGAVSLRPLDEFLALLKDRGLAPVSVSTLLLEP